MGSTPRSSPRGARRPKRGDAAIDRNLRSLTTSRPTQLPATTAMRAREVATPTAEDLAEADRDLVLVRKHYVPPTPLKPRRPRSGNGRSQDGRSQDGRGQDSGGQDGRSQDGNAGG